MGKFNVVMTYLLVPILLVLIIMIWSLPLENTKVEEKIFFTILWSFMVIGVLDMVTLSKGERERER